MRRIWLLHNAQAGRPAYVRRVDRVAEVLARQGVSVQLERHTDIEGLRQAARAAVAAGADAVLVAGGDGTNGTLAGELAGTPVALGVLPAGTANVWAKTLGIPRVSLTQPDALERAALLLLDSPACLADMGRANERWFLMWAGVGLDAYVTQQFERQRQRSRQLGGFLYNFILTFVVARGWRSADLRIETTGASGTREIGGRFHMATVCNIGWHGGGLFQFTDDVRLDDGVMDLWAFAGEGYADALIQAARVLRRAHQPHPAVFRLTGDHFKIYTAAPQAIQTDGEPQPATQTLTVQVVPRCLRLLVPPTLARNLFLNSGS